MPSVSATQALEELNISAPATKISSNDSPKGEMAVNFGSPIINGDLLLTSEQTNGKLNVPDSDKTETLNPEHILGEGVQLMPVLSPVKKPFKPTPEMKAHLADVKARTKERATKVCSRPLPTPMTPLDTK